jgi:transcriptional regulator with XRE-family HTH domain
MMSRRPNPVFGESYALIRRVLVRAREDAGLTQRAVAARLGRWPSHIARIECGQRRIDLLEFCQLAAVLGLDPTTLLARIVAQAGSGSEDVVSISASSRPTDPRPAPGSFRSAV